VRDFGKALFWELAILLMLSIPLRACGLWISCQPDLCFSGQSSNIPVKVLPKMSSSGGTRFFGVVVLVMESFEGSRPGRCLIEASSVFRLYHLEQLGFMGAGNEKEIDDVPERRKICSALLVQNSLGGDMLSGAAWKYSLKRVKRQQFFKLAMLLLLLTPCDKSSRLSLSNYKKVRSRR
jgi:hypothetical protein